MMSQKIIKLFENCTLTKGAARSMIIDMHRQNYYLVPNSMVILFDENHVFNTDSIDNTKENNETIQEYIDFLMENELCFYCDESLLHNFPLIDLNKWDYPAKITNAIIELDFKSPENAINILKDLIANYFTRHFEIQAVGIVDLDTVEDVLVRIDELDLYNYNLIIGFNTNELESGIRLLQEHYKIFRSIIHSTGKTDIILSAKGGWGNIFLIKDAFSNTQCGVVDTYNFSNNIEHVTESQLHNTCLNRKVAIDINGNIKNCLGMCNNHGNTKNVSINEVIKNPEFQKMWNIKKDDIAICKDCEFRHICTDCRAFTEDPEDLYSKPLKCGYDPYTNEWQEWSTLPFKQKAIDYYGIAKDILKTETI